MAPALNIRPRVMMKARPRSDWDDGSGNSELYARRLIRPRMATAVAASV